MFGFGLVVLLLRLLAIFSGKLMLGPSNSSFFIFGGRPKRGATSQSLDLRGLPTFPLRTGGVLVLVADDDFNSLCQSCSQTKLPANM